MDADSILDGLALWDEHKPQTGRDWIAIARRSVAAEDYDPSVGSALFQGLYAAVKALERIAAGDVPGEGDFADCLQACAAAALALPRTDQTNTTQGDPMNITAEQIARVCHETNRGWCDATGDTSQKSWDDAEQWQRDSAIEGVSVAMAGATPEQQHDAWCDSKVRDGWVYGDVKDAAAKTHPCLVSYAELPAEQKIKDGLYIAVVSTLARTSTDERYPYDEADTTVIGPQCFAAKDGSVLNWRGENYVPQAAPGA